MKGYQITFFTQEGRRHGHTPMAEWLLHVARECGASGCTLVSGREGFGHAGALHSAHFFELADQPQAVMVSADEATCARLFARIDNEDVALSYVKVPVEFGRIGKAAQGGGARA